MTQINSGAQLYTGFVAAYPEFSGLPQATAEYELECAALALSPMGLAGRWKLAAYLRAAHRLALRFNITEALEEQGLNPGLASAGLSTSLSAGTGSLSQSLSWSALATGGDPLAADFARTGYGLQYLALLEEAAPLGWAVISQD